MVGIDEATALIRSPQGDWRVEGAGHVHVFVDASRADIAALSPSSTRCSSTADRSPPDGTGPAQPAGVSVIVTDSITTAFEGSWLAVPRPPMASTTAVPSVTWPNLL